MDCRTKSENMERTQRTHRDITVTALSNILINISNVTRGNDSHFKSVLKAPSAKDEHYLFFFIARLTLSVSSTKPVRQGTVGKSGKLCKVIPVNTIRGSYCDLFMFVIISYVM